MTPVTLTRAVAASPDQPAQPAPSHLQPFVTDWEPIHGQSSGKRYALVFSPWQLSLLADWALAVYRRTQP